MYSGISIIVPFLNESDCIDSFCRTFDEYVKALDFETELVFVDDGSVDNTVDIIKAFQFNFVSKVQIVQFSKNFGSHAAIRAGFKHASYDICTWVSADLQEPLEIIKIAYDKISEGYDVVYFDKRSVGVSASNRLFSRIYSYLMIKYAVTNYSSGGTAVIAGNRKIIDFLNANIESNSSVMLQIIDAGFKNCTVSLDFNERSVGASKWTLNKKIKLFIDSFVAFSFMPIRLVSMVGVMLFFIGVVLSIFIVIDHFINGAAPMGYATIVCTLLLGFGVTNISLGIIAEYLWRAYDAARKRPVFIESDVIVVKENEKRGKEA